MKCNVCRRYEPHVKFRADGHKTCNACRYERDRSGLDGLASVRHYAPDRQLWDQHGPERYMDEREFGPEEEAVAREGAELIVAYCQWSEAADGTEYDRPSAWDHIEAWAEAHGVPQRRECQILAAASMIYRAEHHTDRRRKAAREAA
jgi:hypothetical protein